MNDSNAEIALMRQKIENLSQHLLLEMKNLFIGENLVKENELIKMYACTLLTIVGILVHLLSFNVFMCGSKKAPRILSKNVLITLTLSNSIYLILYWYIFILPIVIKNNQIVLKIYENKSNFAQKSIKIDLLDIEKYHLVNSNIWMCKFVNYFYKVFLFMNSAMTVMFSLERAVNIIFPIKMRSLRSKHRFLFKYIITIVIVYCFGYPTYYLYLLDIITSSNQKTVCKIQNKSLYFKLTILYVLQTLAIPFILITISNILILVAMKQTRQNLLVKSISYNAPNATTQLLISNNPKKLKKMRMTKILILISASFVLLRLPYFIAWCRFAIFTVYTKKPFDEEKRNELKMRNEIVDYTEVVNILNYALTGLLYFVAGNSFQKRLRAFFRACYNFLQKIFGCK